MPKFGPNLPRSLAAGSHLVLQHHLSRRRGGRRVLRSAYGLATRVRRRPAANWHRDDYNFGDQMAPFLLQAATDHTPIWVPSWYQGKILSTGSLIHRIQAGDVVWGTGAIKDLPVEIPATARVLAVRGPLTRKLLRADVPEIYGDPALLLPRYYDEPQVVTYEIGVVPHYLDKRFMRSPPDPAILTIDVQADWRIVVDNIRKCRSILSSSLHGLIVAEAFGIPATWVSAGDRLPGGEFKFHDYYLATGREPPAALPWDGRPPQHWRAPPPPRIELEPLLVAAKGIVDQPAGP